MFELIATDYYDEIYGDNAGAMKFDTLVSCFQIVTSATMAYFENSLYNDNVLKMSDEDLDKRLQISSVRNGIKRANFVLQIRVLT